MEFCFMNFNLRGIYYANILILREICNAFYIFIYLYNYIFLWRIAWVELMQWCCLFIFCGEKI